MGQDPKKVRGAQVICGTRVPVALLFENLRDGVTIDLFPDWFPGVERWQVESVLDYDQEWNKPADSDIETFEGQH